MLKVARGGGALLRMRLKAALAAGVGGASPGAAPAPIRGDGRTPPGEGGLPRLSLGWGLREGPAGAVPQQGAAAAAAPPETNGETRFLPPARLLRALRLRRARPIGWAKARPPRPTANPRRQPAPGPGLTGLAANRRGRVGTERGSRLGTEVGG